MDASKDVFKSLGERAEKLKDSVSTEEATKMSLVAPFIQALGFDVFNPQEVIPEFVADIGIKKGEKIDYCILMQGEPTILIECKHWKENLDPHYSQLFRYFHTTRARFAILTNGFKYRFYTDLVEANKMDEEPFLEVDITDLKDSDFEELAKFCKANFDPNIVLSTASELKFIGKFKRAVSEELNNPTAEFLRYFLRDLHAGKITERIVEQHMPIFKRAIGQVINEYVDGRLMAALTGKPSTTIGPVAAPVEVAPVDEATNEASKVVTTTTEMEGFYIVKSILRQVVDPNRIYYRDNQSYFAVLLDDNNRRGICRLYLDGSKKYLGIIMDKKETKYQIEEIDDIFSHAAALIESTSRFVAEGVVA